jgi:hypothetical protein
MVFRQYLEELPFVASGFGLSWDETLEFEGDHCHSHDGD